MIPEPRIETKSTCLADCPHFSSFSQLLGRSPIYTPSMSSPSKQWVSMP